MATAVWYTGVGSTPTYEHDMEVAAVFGRMLKAETFTPGTGSPLIPPKGAGLVEVIPGEAENTFFIWISNEGVLASDKFKPIIASRGSHSGDIKPGDRLAHGTSVP